MIVVIWMDGFGQIRQYKDEEHGWTFPSPEAAVKAAKRAIKQGAVRSDVCETKQMPWHTDPDPVLGVDTTLHTFERGANGQAVERRVGG